MDFIKNIGMIIANIIVHIAEIGFAETSPIGKGIVA
jgi:hypothetical protein